MWKDIEGYEGLYAINENADIYSYKTQKLKIPQVSKDGYYTVQLWKNGNAKRYKLHRLVAIAFIPNPNNYPIVMHLDNNKLNPNVNNLQWGTLSQNSQQAYADGLMHYPETAKPHTIYELYNDDKNIKYRILGYREASSIIQYDKDSFFSVIKRNSTIYKGPFTGFKMRSTTITEKPFTINIQS